MIAINIWEMLRTMEHYFLSITFPWLIKEEKVRYVVIPLCDGQGSFSETFNVFPSANPNAQGDKRRCKRKNQMTPAA